MSDMFIYVYKCRYVHILTYIIHMEICTHTYLHYIRVDMYTNIYLYVYTSLHQHQLPTPELQTVAKFYSCITDKFRSHQTIIKEFRKQSSSCSIMIQTKMYKETDCIKFAE